ncbi:MAG TPA: AarF/UbiB family protein [Acidobacteriota bacterium]|nr:AarF/UbiB family protein [Acidobacteriota bacterium]
MGRILRWLAVFWTFLSPLWAQVDLPSPQAHLSQYNAQQEALALAGEILSSLQPEQRQRVMGLVGQIRGGSVQDLSPERVEELLDTIGWQQHRVRILELALHQSGVLEIVPEDKPAWRHLVHDALLFFLDKLSRQRLIDRLLTQLGLPPDASRGERMLRLADRTPSLQKLGQILARQPEVPEDIRNSLQQLENSISTTEPQQLIDDIVEDVGRQVLEQYRVEFADRVLAEASVGAVIRASLVFPGEEEPRQAVCKVIKDYAVTALEEDLDIFSGLALYFEEHADHYGLGSVPLSEMFREVRNALLREVQVVEEQNNLRRAHEYYSGQPKVKIPRIYPISTDRVTFMEFIEGGKITDAFVDNEKARSHLADQLSEILILDVLFAQDDPALFHGDPHAGNVFYYEGQDEPDQQSPRYRIALLDWGLAGTLPRTQRKQIVQLLLGVQLNDAKRMRQNASALVEGGIPDTPQDRVRVDAIVTSTLASRGKADPFTVLSDFITRLAQAGYRINFNLGLYIKAQITAIGILKELDPDFDLAGDATGRLGIMILKESPKRLLNTVYFPNWTQHNYPSMVSNEDIRDVQFQYIGRGFRRLGIWIWKGISFPLRAFR